MRKNADMDADISRNAAISHNLGEPCSPKKARTRTEARTPTFLLILLWRRRRHMRKKMRKQAYADISPKLALASSWKVVPSGVYTGDLLLLLLLLPKTRVNMRDLLLLLLLLLLRLLRGTSFP